MVKSRHVKRIINTIYVAVDVINMCVKIHLTPLMAVEKILGENIILRVDMATHQIQRAQWLSGRASESGVRGPGFEPHDRRVVSLSKTL